MSEPAPKPSPNQNRDLVTRFRDEYTAALVDARVSVEHTATEGWRKIYADERNREILRRHNLSQTLRNIADRLETRGLSEEEEKEISDAKKASVEIRDSHQVFMFEIVEAVKEPVRICDQIIDDAKSQAHRDERDAPLVNVGLTEIMEMEIVKHPRPRWNGETGQVTIEQPAT